MLAEISSAELAEWLAYYTLEPFGEAVADQRHGIAVATLANVNRDSKRKPAPYKATDFIYWHPVHQKNARLQKVQATAPVDAAEQSRLIRQLLFKAS